MGNFLAELKQRQIFKVATIYVVSAWPLIQMADILAPAMGLPDTVIPTLLQIFVIGFPICLGFAWLINFTPQGMRLASKDDVGDESSPSSALRVNLRAIITVVGSLLLAVLLTIGIKLASDEPATLPAQTDAAPIAPEQDKESIAVLPFVAFSDDQQDEFFVDGMVEELLNLLAKIPDLQVAARTSSFAYKGVKDKTIVEIGKELGVDTILEGSLRKNDVSNRIRITAQLIRVSNGEHIWSEVYDREYRDIFQIQDDIARAVVGKMETTLLGEQREVEFIAATSSVDAMVAFGKGQKELNHRSVPSLQLALEHFTLASESDPGYARAWVGIADARILLALYGATTNAEQLPLAQAALDRAFALEPDLAAAHATQGLLFNQSRQFQDAEQRFEKAIELNPSYAMAYNWYGSLLQEKGDQSGAHELYKKAFELDPKSPVAAFNVAWGHYLKGAEDVAMEYFSKIVANDPYYPGAYLLVGQILSNRGRIDEAMQMFERALQVDPQNSGALNGMLISSMDLQMYEVAELWFDYAQGSQTGGQPLLTEQEIYLMRARLYASKLDKESAIRELQKADLSAEDPFLHASIQGEIAYFQGDFATALRYYEQMRGTSADDERRFLHVSEGNIALHAAWSYQQIGETNKATELTLAYDRYLQQEVSKKANRPAYYFNMARLSALRNNDAETLNYLQGAIDSGWTQVWNAQIEPMLQQVVSQQRFTLMMGGVKARLANMRTKAERKTRQSFASQ